MDKEKIEYLWCKRRSRTKLTPNEDAALAHTNARYWAFAFGAEAKARARLRLLKDKERIHGLANGSPLSPWEKGESNVLRIFYPPEIPELSADHEAFLERESIFSECPFDSDGYPVEYMRGLRASIHSSHEPFGAPRDPRHLVDERDGHQQSGRYV